MQCVFHDSYRICEPVSQPGKPDRMLLSTSCLARLPRRDTPSTRYLLMPISICSGMPPALSPMTYPTLRALLRSARKAEYDAAKWGSARRPPSWRCGGRCRLSCRLDSEFRRSGGLRHLSNKGEHVLRGRARWRPGILCNDLTGRVGCYAHHWVCME